MLEPRPRTENWTLSINPNQRNPQRGCYLALTFGTLLSSQGADALVLQPFRPSFEAVSPLYTVLRSSPTSGVRPAVSQACGPVCSRSVQEEQYTTSGALCRGVRGGGPPVPCTPLRLEHRCRSSGSEPDLLVGSACVRAPRPGAGAGGSL